VCPFLRARVIIVFGSLPFDLLHELAPQALLLPVLHAIFFEHNRPLLFHLRQMIEAIILCSCCLLKTPLRLQLVAAAAPISISIAVGGGGAADAIPEAVSGSCGKGCHIGSNSGRGKQHATSISCNLRGREDFSLAFIALTAG
jgi:hypothetical protein